MRVSPQEDAARLGEPSYLWRAGQQRRLNLICTAAQGRERGRILDNGCGVGLYLSRLSRLADTAVGLELDPVRARQARAGQLVITMGAGENLPFAGGSFDLILSHEVIEHVRDDRTALAEMARLLRQPDPAQGTAAGRLIVFAPNRGYPFETHGIYWRGRYRFGNIPLVNYLPGALRDQLAPHVRAYSTRSLKRLLRDLPLRVIRSTIIFGAYDNLIARWGALGRALRAGLHLLERTPLRILGLSHFLVLERTE